MLTFALILADAYSTNTDFDPSYLYVGTLLLDMMGLFVFNNLNGGKA